jgi:phage shock protein E
MKVKLLGALAGLLVLGVLLARGQAADVSGAEARRLVASGARLVDVRTPAEFAEGHLEGAVNIPLDELERRLAEVGPRDRPVVLYCRSGRRSAIARKTLERAGWKSVRDLGPISAW